MGQPGNRPCQLANTGSFENSYETNPSDGTPDWMWIFYMNSVSGSTGHYWVWQKSAGHVRPYDNDKTDSQRL